MKYTLIYTRSAIKDLQKLDAVVKNRIKKKLEKFAREPFITARKLTDPVLGSYRWRIGNYRIVFDVEKAHIVILRIRHRKEVYNRS